VSATTSSDYAPSPEKIKDIAQGSQALFALISLVLYWFSLGYFRTNWKRWTFWACCIGLYSLLGF
jgi:hypothetical protein